MNIFSQGSYETNLKDCEGGAIFNCIGEAVTISTLCYLSRRRWFNSITKNEIALEESDCGVSFWPLTAELMISWRCICAFVAIFSWCYPSLRNVLKLIDSCETSLSDWDRGESLWLLAILAWMNLDAMGEGATSLTLVYKSARSDWTTFFWTVLKECDGRASFWFSNRLVMMNRNGIGQALWSFACFSLSQSRKFKWITSF